MYSAGNVAAGCLQHEPAAAAAAATAAAARVVLVAARVGGGEGETRAVTHTIDIGSGKL